MPTSHPPKPKFEEWSPESVYVHIPFCSHKCGYCNFAVVADRTDLVPAYLDALSRDLEVQVKTQETVQTLFLGGGTPSNLSPKQFDNLAQLLHQRFSLADDCEFSCEVNPVDCTSELLESLKRAGVNRVSIGGQSFSNRKLEILERDHQKHELVEAIETCSRFFDNVSLDLIFAAPDESLSEWKNDLKLACSLPINHLSTYGLTIEKGSSFFGRVLRKEIKEVDSDKQAELYELTIDELTGAGWEHYEVSSFARAGKRCEHNQNYWQGNLWRAFGPSAASFLLNEQLSRDSHPFARAVNHHSTTNYIRRLQSGMSPVAERDELSWEHFVRERLVFGLRQIRGVDLAALRPYSPIPLEDLFAPYLQKYIDDGWLVQEGKSLRLSRAGLMISDSLWPDLLFVESR